MSSAQKCPFILGRANVKLHYIINLCLLTNKQDEAGPLVELHSIGLGQLQHRPGVPGEESTLRVVQHLHPALSRDHVTLWVQQNQRGNTWKEKDEESMTRVEAKTEEGRKRAAVWELVWVISFNYHFMTQAFPSPTEIYLPRGYLLPRCRLAPLYFHLCHLQCFYGNILFISFAAAIPVLTVLKPN